MRLRYLVVALMFLAAFASNHWEQLNQRHPPQSKQAAQPAAPDQRGTDQVPLTVKILPAQDAEKQADKAEHKQRRKR